jgi:hypothetical protein
MVFRPAFPALSAFTVLSLILLVAASATAQTVRVAAHDEPPPEDLADPIEALVAAGGQRVAIGSATLEFWWVKSMPLAPASTALDWSAVDEGTLVGAVAISAAFPDARGRTIRPGIYTLRYGVEAVRRDHAGAPPHHPLLLLAPSAADSSAATLGRDGSVALSRLVTGAAQPAAWAIEPAAGDRDAIGTAKPAGGGHLGIVFAVPASRDGRDAGVLKFALVLSATVHP